MFAIQKSDDVEGAEPGVGADWGTASTSEDGAKMTVSSRNATNAAMVVNVGMAMMYDLPKRVVCFRKGMKDLKPKISEPAPDMLLVK